jgi:signal transduction histidine kinase/CheY-like chemotaxis protein
MISPLRLLKTSLMARLVSSFLLLSLATVGMITSLVYWQARGLLQQAVIDRLTAISDIRENAWSRWLEEQRQDTLFIAQQPDLRLQAEALLSLPPSDPAYATANVHLREYLAAGIANQPNLQEIFILDDVFGQVIVSTDPSHQGLYRISDSYFIQGRQSTYVQKIYASPITGKPTITIATPLFSADGRRRLGVLAVLPNLARLDQLMGEQTQQQTTGETYLVSRFNEFVSAERFGREEFPRGVHSLGIDAAVRGQNGSGLYLNYRGVPVVGVYRWLGEQDLALLAEVSEAEAFAPARQLALTIIGVGILSAALAALFAYFRARQIAHPILMIAETALQVAHGDLSRTTPVLTEDEVGKLARAFNQMTAELRTLYANLEQKVVERTHELRQAKVAAEAAALEAQEARRAADAANRAKSIFLANMSHELRTPLNAILGFSQLMAHAPGLNIEQQKNLHTIRRSGEHLLELINDVLDLAKIEAARMVLVESNFDLHRLLDELASMFRLRATQKGLTLTVDYGLATRRYIRTDEKKVRQVLVNLLDNALKFTQTGGIALRVRLTRVESGPPAGQPAGIQLQFEVEDSGPGIAPEELEMMFEAFAQTATGRRSQEGTGLGLPISRQLARLLAGEVSATSTVGRGSLFTFTLRAIEVPAAEAAPAQNARPHALGLAPAQPAYRLLVVDDDEISRLLLTQLLTSMGFEVRSAVDGQAALAMWQAWRPHLIWMDWQMPVMDGEETLRRIKATPEGKNTVVVALTASLFEAEQTPLSLEGCDDFISKPFQEEEIIDALIRHLGARFVYEGAPALPLPHPAGNGSGLNFTGLPPAWLGQLEQATLGLDAQQIETLVNQIRPEHPDLANEVLRQVNNFDYDALIAAITAARASGQPPEV